MSNMAIKAVGIDIGGTGIKGAIVDVSSGKLLTDRIKLPTPQGGEPEDILATVLEIVKRLDVGNKKDPIGVCFPAVVVKGKTLSAANVSKSWIGLEAEKLFEKGLGRNIHFVNDADAAGYAETLYGAAAKSDGLIIMTTLGTGIGTALIYKGVLIPNAELGHIQLDGVDYETRASYSAKERENLSWVDWAARLQQYYTALEAYFHPDLFILGGGVSKEYKNFLSLLHLNTPIVPATLRNNAGILGAAALAAGR
ncbi:polyphosphate--glucose phosphotransferase [Lacisediminihabitans sp.]|uniref:polyphosphate--glucose phosphotransferase n=1 Tax=Lacisediminihabitans sp. TaxID=2787631 RepID=UPI0039C92E31